MDRLQFDAQEKKYFAEIYRAYSATKSLFIDAEEKLSKMNTFLAPLLEHRDALDHIMRFYEYTNEGKFTEEALRELANARAHEIRAYFDVADYICINVRGEIASGLNSLSGWQIEKVWTEYNKIRKQVSEISENIAAIRKCRIDSLSYIDKYNAVISELFVIYNEFETNILPKMKKKYPWQFSRISK